MEEKQTKSSESNELFLPIFGSGFSSVSFRFGIFCLDVVRPVIQFIATSEITEAFADAQQTLEDIRVRLNMRLGQTYTQRMCRDAFEKVKLKQ